MSTQTQPLPALEPKPESLSPLSLEQILPNYNERVLFCGRTRSGKTTLAERMLRHYPFVVVLDTKGKIVWPGYERHEFLQSLMQSEHTHLIYAPAWAEHPENSWESVEKFFRWAYDRGNNIIYVDEVMSVTRGDVMPQLYRAAVVRGGELGVGVWSATQRPTRIPQVLLSETEHFYIFKLQLSQDLIKAADAAEVLVEDLPIVREHEFIYIRQGSDNPPQKLLLVE